MAGARSPQSPRWIGPVMAAAAPSCGDAVERRPGQVDERLGRDAGQGDALDLGRAGRRGGSRRWRRRRGSRRGCASATVNGRPREGGDDAPGRRVAGDGEPGTDQPLGTELGRGQRAPAGGARLAAAWGTARRASSAPEQCTTERRWHGPHPWGDLADHTVRRRDGEHVDALGRVHDRLTPRRNGPATSQPARARARPAHRQLGRDRYAEAAGHVAGRRTRDASELAGPRGRPARRPATRRRDRTRLPPGGTRSGARSAEGGEHEGTLAKARVRHLEVGLVHLDAVDPDDVDVERPRAPAHDPLAAGGRLERRGQAQQLPGDRPCRARRPC